LTFEGATLPRFEFGHLYKFIVSFGLVLVFAGIALPWFVFQASNALKLKSVDLLTFTDVAQNALAVRQAQLSWIVNWYPLASILLAAIGLLSVGYGFSKWRSRQLVYDEKENIQRDMDRVNYTRMSATELEVKLEREAIVENDLQEQLGPDSEAAAALDEDDDEEESRDGDTLPIPEPRHNNPSELTELTELNGPDLEDSEFRNATRPLHRAIAEVTSQIANVASLAFEGTHRVELGVRLAARHGDRGFFADLLLVSNFLSVPSIAMEVSYSKGIKSLSIGLADKLIRFGALSIGEGPGARIRGVLVLVVDGDLTIREFERISKQWREANSLLRIPVSGVVVSRSKLDYVIPSEFAVAVHSAQDFPESLWSIR
jgi:hypothetical protein